MRCIYNIIIVSTANFHPVCTNTNTLGQIQNLYTLPFEFSMRSTNTKLY